jgi:hypothetical protein
MDEPFPEWEGDHKAETSSGVYRMSRTECRQMHFFSPFHLGDDKGRLACIKRESNPISEEEMGLLLVAVVLTSFQDAVHQPNRCHGI